tara:strand:- start:154 stop:405 length:252 start_codon:yes stop_codon:yes gene_type:complete
MTKKHFEMVAKVLSDRARAISNSSATNKEKAYALFELRNTMFQFNDEFQEINKNFDEVKFREACKVEGYLNAYQIELSNKGAN